VSDAPLLLLAHHLKALKLPTFLREHDKLARQCAAEGADHTAYLLRLAEFELLERERRMIERRIREAHFPAVKSLDSFDFAAIPALNKMLVLELARGTYLEQRENVIALGPSGTGKTHIALGLGLAACQRGLAVGFTTAAALVHELLEARDERRLLRLQKLLTAYKLLIVDELGYVPLSPSGAELLFEVFSRRYERGSVLVTSNLPFDEWTAVFGSERPAHAPRPHPRDERRELSPEGQPAAAVHPAGRGREQSHLRLRSTPKPLRCAQDPQASRLVHDWAAQAVHCDSALYTLARSWAVILIRLRLAVFQVGLPQAPLAHRNPRLRTRTPSARQRRPR
jgi:DNA replication protein DnaC